MLRDERGNVWTNPPKFVMPHLVTTGHDDVENNSHWAFQKKNLNLHWQNMQTKRTDFQKNLTQVWHFSGNNNKYNNTKTIVIIHRRITRKNQSSTKEGKRRSEVHWSVTDTVRPQWAHFTILSLLQHQAQNNKCIDWRYMCQVSIEAGNEIASMWDRDC